MRKKIYRFSFLLTVICVLLFLCISLVCQGEISHVCNNDDCLICTVSEIVGILSRLGALSLVTASIIGLYTYGRQASTYFSNSKITYTTLVKMKVKLTD